MINGGGTAVEHAGEAAARSETSMDIASALGACQRLFDCVLNRTHRGTGVCRYFSVSVCHPGFVHFPLRITKTSVTRPDVVDRLPAVSVSYRYWL